MKIIILVTTLLTLSGQPTLAQARFSPPIPEGPTNPVELGDFMDTFIPRQLNAHHIPGATVVVVKSGTLFFAKGYGYANLEKRQPVIVDETAFRIGSVTKLFTWTAVMQLVEQGKLDLQADINTYLQDLQIPTCCSQPITLAHLLTHTSGLQDRINTSHVRSADDLLPLAEFLPHNIPAQVYPPGELVAYSNYGPALAGYIIEQVSGIPFEQYVEKNILEPLDMRHSTLDQPLPPELAPSLATGYTYEKGVYHPGEFEYLQQTPAGSMSATATDMAQFMIAHLQGGHYGDAHILQQTTAQEMQRQHFSHDPRLNGMTWGFIEMDRNAQQIIGHGGSTGLFHTLLALLPQQDVGLFVSYNSAGGAQARQELLQAFLDRYYPTNVPTPQPLSDFQQRVNRFVGSYRKTSSPYTLFEKINKLFGETTVIANPDGTLQIDQSSYIEIEPLVFQHIHGQDILIFRQDNQGRVTHMFMNSSPTTAFIKLPWYSARSFQIKFLVMCGGIFLSALTYWPLGALVNRRRGRSSLLRSNAPRLARGLASGLCALNLLLVGALLVIIMPDLIPSMPGSLETALKLLTALTTPFLPITLTAGIVILTLLVWKGQYWSTWGRLHYTLIMLTALAFIWRLNSWNLWNFKL